MYSVLVNKRPIKFSFLVNPQLTDWQVQLDAIWEYNLDKWGGRFNTIIPTDGKEIQQDWWQFLKKVDPDYVIATTALTNELKDQIEVEVCPISIELARPDRNHAEKPQIFTQQDTIQVIPTPRNIAKLARNPFLEPQLVVFRCGHNPDEDVKGFIRRNFGEYSIAYYWTKLLERVNCREFSVSTRTELVEALRLIGKPPGNYVYPIQISALESPNLYLENKHEHSYDVFGLVVGDTFEDQIFSWHKVFYSLTNPGRLNHLWLPTAFVDDLEIMEALGEWLRRMTENVHLFSFSISENELNEIGERLDGPKTARPLLRPNLYKSVTSYSRFTFPEFSKDRTHSFWDRFSYPLSPPKEAEYYRAYGLNEEFEIKSPVPAEGLQEKGHWMGEVFIDADQKRFYNEEIYYGQTSSFWWQLPRKNYLAVDIFKQKARINSQGIPTIPFPAKNPQLKFQLPDEGKLLRRCVLGDIRGKMSGLVKRNSLNIEQAGFSNIGKYLLGFLEVFGGLASAHDILSERYWRNMFDTLSGRDPVKDQKMLDRVKGKLRNKMKSGLTSVERITRFENLAPFVIQLAKEITAAGETKVFNDFQEEARKEHEEFKKEQGVDWEFNENAVRNEISRMLEAGVLQMGFEQKCPRCGSTNWFLIDEVSQHLLCDGCRYNFSIPGEPAISYRLNSLVRQGIFIHGLIPVVLVLGQLLKDSHSSFFFTPSLDLFTHISDEPLSYKRIGDLDIVCIQDGKFIIGEIKQDQSRFELEQSMKLAEIAEAVGADILLFSSLDKEQSNATKEMIHKVKEKLKDSKVQVGWYQLGKEIFEPSRMDH